ncbi:MAG: UDP-3-O-(3-hydroxymyristoyl)glucosamine N-acyltransferase [Pseudanabaenaceae cyanobacterium]|jgi:UDP-3-O-[3-hydroxymyristoyl] glucosamine N-acyltransferase
MSYRRQIKLSELADLLPDCQLDAQGQDPLIDSVAAIDQATTGAISFVNAAKFVKYLATTAASAVVIDPQTPCALPCLRTTNPRLLFAKILEIFEQKPILAGGIHPTVIIGEGGSIGANVNIGAGVVIGDRVRLGDGVQIFPNTTIYEDVTIGNHTIIHSNCVLREGTQVGQYCLLHPSVVLGADGFGFEPQRDGTWYKMPQTGYVVLEDHVELGCLTAVDRPAVGITLISRGCKFDNQVQIGHGVKVGPHTVIAAQSGLAGGAVLGHHVVLAGQVGVAGHISVGDGTVVGPKSGVPKSLDAGVTVMGYPPVPEKTWKRIAIAERQLPELLHTVRKLTARIEQLEQNAAANETA